MDITHELEHLARMWELAATDLDPALDDLGDLTAAQERKACAAQLRAVLAGRAAEPAHNRLLPGESGVSGVYADDDRDGGYLRVIQDEQGDVYFSVHPLPRDLSAPTVRMVGHCTRRPHVIRAARALAAALEQ